MLFNSFEFLIFFPVVTLVYFLLPHRFRWMHLLAASCVFYCAFIPVYILILFLTIIIDYFAGIAIESSHGKKRKRYLVISIISNIGILAVFKYYNFFIENINELLGSGIKDYHLPMLKIILPIGLSFHTFQAMSYTIEVYRGNFKAERHFGIYALYVMFYPQLVAGPIERPQNVLHQFREKHNFNPVLFQAGLRLMLWGLFKKVVIADRLAIYVDGVFDSPEQLGSLNYILATVFFSVQIYCDFSGYSDIAIGSARTMGFDLMTNFNRPYFSTNIREFWSRWHISLSTWFRDYLYIPLGGNRVSKSRLYYNTVIVFMLSGFWHGAKWTFVVWGGLHAIYSVIHMATKSYFEKMKKRFGWYRLAAVFTTFALVSFAWIFFRANNLHSAGHVISGWFSGGQGFTRVLGPNEIMIMTFIAIMVAFMFFVESRTTPSLTELNTKFNVDLLLSTTVLILIICFGVFNRNSFIYFQF